MLSRQQKAELIGFDPEGFPVVSLYLNVDGSQYSPHQNAQRAHQLVRQALTEAEAQNWSEAERESLQNSLNALTHYIEEEFEREDWRGLALFSCAARGFWQAYPLHRPVADRIEVNAHPYIRPLVALSNDYSRYGVLLVDSEKARYFIVDLGQIQELDFHFDPALSRSHTGSRHGASERRMEHHGDHPLHRHIKHVVTALQVVVEKRGLEKILLHATPEVLPELIRTLPRSLGDRVVEATDHVRTDIGPQEVLAESLKIIQAVEAHEEAKLVALVNDSRGTNGFAVVGLEETLRALYYDAVNLLIVERDFAASGCQCAACGRLFTQATSCPECQSQEYHPLSDVVEAAIEGAYRLDAEIAFLTPSSAEPPLGNIGAMLRFHLPVTT